MALKLILRSEAESAGIGRKMHIYFTAATLGGKSLTHFHFPQLSKEIYESLEPTQLRATVAEATFQRGLAEKPEFIKELETHLPDRSKSLKDLFNEATEIIFRNLAIIKRDLIEGPVYSRMPITESSTIPPAINRIEKRLSALFDAEIWLKKASDKLDEASVPDGTITSKPPWQEK
ncbi:predicted protein [Plenodomus lingam JN3]|uniref:Predicted protein n=1 Tax=Leptosphaeria maculans (strain JN3 / isolate v23.1.3 / race Av1-4-5-6-7-8) TaxID=985895 RepID=E5AE64_LEPMJ|nr:predicted protein [Plenodomus lingam JN3]CBY01503.1 predicted protein [Plenodomus lingam JN3]